MSQDDVERVARAMADAFPLSWKVATEAQRAHLRDVCRAALSAMPGRVSPELIAKLNALASRLTQMGEYEACDLIDTVVERVSAMPPRELLAEALDALSQLSFAAQTSGGTAGRDDALVAAIDHARAAADKIRASLTQEKQT